MKFFKKFKFGRKKKKLDKKKVTDKGCSHYPRNCELLAPCCDKFYVCRKCHDEVELNHKDSKDNHHLDRYSVITVRCLGCSKEQKVSDKCVSCGCLFARYCCLKCNLFDDTPNKQIYHCEGCKLCRIGKMEDNIHCERCGMCISRFLFEEHKERCIPGAFKGNCPICLANLQLSTSEVFRTACGHAIHKDCLQEVITNNENDPMKIKCPVCQKLMLDLDDYQEFVKGVIQKTPVPKEMQKKVPIVCCECNKKAEVDYHFYGLECPKCGSLNTKEIKKEELDEESESESEEEYYGGVGSYYGGDDSDGCFYYGDSGSEGTYYGDGPYYGGGSDEGC